MLHTRIQWCRVQTPEEQRRRFSVCCWVFLPAEGSVHPGSVCYEAWVIILNESYTVRHTENHPFRRERKFVQLSTRSFHYFSSLILIKHIIRWIMHCTEETEIILASSSLSKTVWKKNRAELSKEDKTKHLHFYKDSKKPIRNVLRRYSQCK